MGNGIRTIFLFESSYGRTTEKENSKDKFAGKKRSWEKQKITHFLSTVYNVYLLHLVIIR